MEGVEGGPYTPMIAIIQISRLWWYDSYKKNYDENVYEGAHIKALCQKLHGIKS